jgi:hypothetical protein
MGRQSGKINDDDEAAIIVHHAGNIVEPPANADIRALSPSNRLGARSWRNPSMPAVEREAASEDCTRDVLHNEAIFNHAGAFQPIDFGLLLF